MCGYGVTTMDIPNRRLEQLKQYAAWEKENYPDDQQRVHVLDWAVDEIEQLRLSLTARDRQIAMLKSAHAASVGKVVKMTEALEAIKTAESSGHAKMIAPS